MTIMVEITIDLTSSMERKQIGVSELKAQSV
jgi:hypothetical protein